MIASFKNLFFSPSQAAAREAYLQVVAQSRQPVFFKEMAVCDTLDGRFDITVLHLFMVIHRLRGEPKGTGTAVFVRALSETFFSDMDRSLREMGVGDTGVGKRIKNMAQAFYGRLQSYEQGVDEPAMLSESIARNLYREQPVDKQKLQAMTDYTQRNIAHLAAQDTVQILSGKVTFLS